MHAHDWPTAPICFGNLTSARSIFTIHNLNYGADLIGRAMSGAAVATTVSPTYAAEVGLTESAFLSLLSSLLSLHVHCMSPPFSYHGSLCPHLCC